MAGFRSECPAEQSRSFDFEQLAIEQTFRFIP
jgi:hypothetical protein